MTAVGFEPTPFRTGAWSQRLRPLGQTVSATPLDIQIQETPPRLAMEPALPVVRSLLAPPWEGSLVMDNSWTTGNCDLHVLQAQEDAETRDRTGDL